VKRNYGKRNFNLPFKETDNPNPHDFYSRIKLAIEMLIKKEIKGKG
jgi:dTDP-4-dehydrorhamnose reductase